MFCLACHEVLGERKHDPLNVCQHVYGVYVYFIYYIYDIDIE